MSFVFNYLRILLGFIQCLSYASALWVTVNNIELIWLGLGFEDKKISIMVGTEMLLTGAFKYMFTVMLCLIFVIATGFIRDLIPKDE